MLGLPVPLQKVNPLSEMVPSISSHCYQQGHGLFVLNQQGCWCHQAWRQKFCPSLCTLVPDWLWGRACSHPGDKARIDHNPSSPRSPAQSWLSADGFPGVPPKW